MSRNVLSSFTPECNGGVHPKMATYDNSAGIVISRHFRVAIVCKTIAKFAAFAQIFHGHFCQLAEIHGILVS
jgi:hypothetical protein